MFEPVLATKLGAVLAVQGTLAVGPFDSPAELVAGIAIVGTAIIGVWTLYVGSKGLLAGYRIWSNDPVPAGNVHLEDGIVEVESAVEPIGTTVNANYSGKECLAYTYKKKKKRRKVDEDEKWRTVNSGEEAVPFYVVDDSGAVAVDPDAATLSLRPEQVTSKTRVREYEGRLEPGDDVHVYGQKRMAADGGAAPSGESIYVGGGDGTFKISDASEARTILRSTARGRAYLLFGVFCLGAAAVVVANWSELLAAV